MMCYLKQTSILMLYLLAMPVAPLQPPDTTQLSLGQTQYQAMASQSSMPRYGSCWMTALAKLEVGCTQLTDQSQARLALGFTNCFLAQSGQSGYPCDDEEDVADCLELVDNNAFTAYSNFFTHTQNMCYFLQSQAWQEQTDNTVHKLSSSSAAVAREMEESHKLQKEISASQQSSLEYQKQLVENGSYLSQAIEASKGNVKDMLDEFRSSTNEQKMLIFEVFDRVATLQNLVVSEVSWLYTVVFYSACLVVIYLVTATKRTTDARLWLFFILTVNFGLERLVIWWSLLGEGDDPSLDFSQLLSNRIWMVRNTAIAMSVLVLTFIAVNFKDYNVINNSLLEEIRRQNLELKMSMENFQVDKKAKAITENSKDTLDNYFPSLSYMLAEDTGFNGDEEEEFSDTDSDSFTSKMTDRTFDPHSAALSSRETTPTNQTMETIPSLNDTYSSQAMSALTSILSCVSPVKSVSTAASCPIIQPGTPTSSARYNFRARRSSSVAPPKQNIEESPKTFGRLVKKQLATSKRNYKKWKQAVGRQEEEGSD